MKKNKKFVKLGIKLMASTVLVGCGVVLSTTNVFNEIVVHAETYTNTSDQLTGVVVWHHAHNTDGSSFRLNGDGDYIEVQPGEEITSSAPEYEGYTLSHTTYAPPAWDGGDGILSYVYKQNEVAEQPKPTPESEVPDKPIEENAIQFTVSHYETSGDSGQKLNTLDTTTYTLEPGEYVDVVAKEFPGYRLVDGMTARVYYEDIIKLDGPYWEFLYVLDSVEEPTNGNNSTDTNTVNYTVQLVDQDGQILQTIQQSGVEGTEVTFEFPIVPGYRVGKAEGFDSWTYGRRGSFRLVANKTVKVYYDKAPSIDSLIRPEQRVEYQKVFDTFHTTVLKAFEVYKKELGVDDITYEANDLEKIFADSNLSTLHSELVLVKPLFDKSVGLVLTDQDIINAIGWGPEYWDYQISYHKEITQKLEQAMANIAASKENPTVPVNQPITIPIRYVSVENNTVTVTGVLYETTATVEPGGSVYIEDKEFEGFVLAYSDGAFKREYSYEDIMTIEGLSDGFEIRYIAYNNNDNPVTPPTDNTGGSTDTPPSDNTGGSAVTTPSDNTGGSTDTPPKDKDNGSDSNGPLDGVQKSTDNKKTGQLAVDKKEKTATPATDSKKEEKSSSGTKTLPNTGQATSLAEMTGFIMLGLIGLAFASKKRRRNS